MSRRRFTKTIIGLELAPILPPNISPMMPVAILAAPTDQQPEGIQ
jgi:small basic protein